MFAVKLEGFKTKKQAEQFLSWYGRQGEQSFYDELDIVGLDSDDGCNVDYSKPVVFEDNTITAQVK